MASSSRKIARSRRWTSKTATSAISKQAASAAAAAAAATAGATRTSASPHPSEPPSIYPSPSPSSDSSPHVRKPVAGGGGISQDTHQLCGAARRALETIIASHRHEYTGPSWVKFPGFTAREYEDLCAAASADDLEFRHDYDSEDKLLVLRMPESPTHNAVKSQLGSLIYELIQRAVSADLEELESLIGLHIEAELTPAAARELDGMKVPDISFTYGTAIHPPFVVEIGYSQKSEDLEYLARKYIQKSNGDIQTVLTVNLDYHNRQRRKELGRQAATQASSRALRSASLPTSTSTQSTSSVCLYRLGKRVMHDILFRDRGIEQAGEIPLTLADFVPEGAQVRPGVTRDVLEATPITIAFSRLIKSLKIGERRQAVHDTTPEPPPQRGRKRVRFDWEPQSQSQVSEPGSQDGWEADGDEQTSASSASASIPTSASASASAAASASASVPGQRPRSKRRRLSERGLGDRHEGDHLLLYTGQEFRRGQGRGVEHLVLLQRLLAHEK